jgi:hypothetical protein
LIRAPDLSREVRSIVSGSCVRLPIGADRSRREEM